MKQFVIKGIVRIIMAVRCSLLEHVNDASVCSGKTETMRELNSDEKELLLFRTKHKVTHLCDGHRQKYLKHYVGNQRHCCDPLASHAKQSRAKQLREITVDMALIPNSLDLVPGKKLCTQCRKQLMGLLKKEKAEQEGGSVKDSESEAEEDLSFSVAALIHLTIHWQCVFMNCRSISRNSVKSAIPMKKIEGSIRKKLKLGDTPPDKEPPSKEVLEYNEILDQLKQTFDETDNRSKKLTILTVLPKSWSMRRI